MRTELKSFNHVLSQWRERIESYRVRYITPLDCRVMGLIVFIAVMGMSYSAINYFTYQYTGFDYLPTLWLTLSPVLLCLLLFACYADDKSPRLAFFTRTYCLYFFTLFSFALLTNGVQYTPFNPIDRTLLKLDQFFHFDTAYLMQWTTSHPAIQKIFLAAYQWLNVEMVLIPLLLPWFYTKERVYEFFMIMSTVFLVGTTFYYFLPTTAPVSIISSPHFLPEEHATYLKYYQVHHSLPVTTGDGGLIAFPSFHVIWACLLCYVTRGIARIFYPLVGLNAMVVLSTVFLGWHYLVDVMGGMLFLILTLFIVKRFVFFEARSKRAKLLKL